MSSDLDSPSRARPRRFFPRLPWPLILAILTVLTSLAAGGAFAGASAPFERLAAAGSVSEATALVARWLWAGWPYAFSLLLFFMAHEMGHYVACRYHRVDCTLPFFIPAPPPFPFGTLGAVIRIRSPILDRRALFDIGVAGPLAGFAVAVPLLVVGLVRSVPTQSSTTGLGWTTLSVLGETVPAILGDSLLTLGMRTVLPGDAPILAADPLLISGWLALLATAMNLIPAGQFDGGHIVYALVPSWHKVVSYCSAFFLLALVATRMVLYGESSAWFAWAFIVLIFGRRHPPVPYPHIPVGMTRWALGLITGLILLLCFAPNPIRILVS